ncbi:hypothetical protein RhiirA4_479777, partial [Rhizophagus irregularis]
DIQSCIDKVRPVRFGEHLNLYELEVTAYSSGYCLGSANWMIDCGGEKISIVSSSSMVQNIHPLPFDETVFSNADVLTFLSLKLGPATCVIRMELDLKLFLLKLEFVMCTERQQKMYLPDNLMHYQDMIEQSLLYYASRTDSSLQEKYQEPCVVFAVHLSLRSGAAINSLESGEIIQAIQ